MDLLKARSIYSDEPPPFQSRNDINPTFLVSWWCTIFSVTIILIRLFGRWVRTEKLFLEDKIMFWSMIPLLIRMGIVHVVLIYGTNNSMVPNLTHEETVRREIGSRLVLAARIFYAAFIWVAKLTVLEFLKRTIGASWARSYEIGLRLIYAFLALTFVAVIISTLSECQPFSHYWQVVPDPGPHCRQGLVQLITMGVCDIVTDIVLIAFPIPVVIASRSMTTLKKLSLVSLFLLSIILIAITSYRIPSTINRRSSQPYRSLIASLEILAATCVANIVIIGSFIRDKGVKKAKFRANSIPDDDVLSRVSTRTKSMALNRWGSDEDLFRDVGLGLPPKLRTNKQDDALRRPAQTAVPIEPNAAAPEEAAHAEGVTAWSPQSRSRARIVHRRRNSDSSISSSSTDIKLRDLRNPFDHPTTVGMRPDSKERQMSFFDVGGLVDKPSSSTTTNSCESSIREMPASNPRAGTGASKAFLADIGAGFPWRHAEDDEADGGRQSRSATRSLHRARFGHNSHLSRITETPAVRNLRPLSTSRDPSLSKAITPDQLNLSDAGGLLKP